MRPEASGSAALAGRLERDTLIVLAVSAAGAAVGWGWSMAGGVLGGGLMAGISYRALKRAVDALAPPSVEHPADVPHGEGAQPVERPTVLPARLALGLIGRYALLLGAGYVIIGRLHLHPLGVLVGVSAVVVAAMVEAVRSWR